MTGEEMEYLPYPFPNGKAPKAYHKQIARWCGRPNADRAMGYGASVDAVRDWLIEVEALAADLLDPVLVQDAVVGWRPMTDAERARSDAASARAKATAEKRRMKKEGAERAQLAKLQAKYGGQR